MNNATLYKVTFYITDVNGDIYPSDIKNILYNAFNVRPRVEYASKEITDWDDDHILNRSCSGFDVYEKYFNEH